METMAIIGPAGSGKTTKLREMLEDDPQAGVLTATTGIAAVNLGPGVTTVNAQLKYFDEPSLAREYGSGRLTSRFVSLARRHKRKLVIDEMSMLSAGALDLLFRAARDAEKTVCESEELRRKDVRPCGIVLTGDFCQLPPVTGKYAFHAQCWPAFEQNLVKLDKIFRQDDPLLLDALKKARAGRGVECAVLLNRLGIKFVDAPAQRFDGVTLFPTNAGVDKYNRERLQEIDAPELTFKSKRWGVPRGEWNKIDERVTLREGALVMILVNETREFLYVNGDLATLASTVEDHEPHGCAKVVTKRGFVGLIPPVIRQNIAYEKPERVQSVEWPEREEFTRHREFWDAYQGYLGQVQMKGTAYFDPWHEGWCIGEIEYMPLRLAYAATYHKMQGLTIDSAQIDCRNLKAGDPAMMYVALSRCRNPEGIQIVSPLARVARRICTSPEVSRWV